MNTRANGDVLYQQKSNVNNNKLNSIIKTAPLIKNKYTHRGHSHWLLGSMTVEASLCVPIFFLVVISLFYVFQILLGINTMQFQMSEAVREYEAYNTKISSVSTFLSDGKMLVWDEDNKLCHVEYKETIPVIGSNFFNVRLYQQMRFSDFKGKSMMESLPDKTDDIYVYITENGRVYHRNSGCSYLNPSVVSCLVNQVDKKRNSSGGRYKPCERCCGANSNGGDVVYITSYGDRYHTDKGCSGIKRGIRQVKLSDVGSMPPCSKCGK